MSKLVSIILPTYNEAENIVSLIEALFAVVEHPLEVIVVDDDSPDRTWELVDALQADDQRVRLLRRTGERGLVSAVRDGIGQASGEVVVWMDCDFSHPPALIPRMLEEIDRGADVVIPSRYVRGGRDQRDETLHRLLSRILNALAALTLDSGFCDWTSGFIAARRTVFETIRLRGDYGEFFISLVFQALRQGRRVREIPYINLSRRRGTSKTATSPTGFAARGWKYLYTVARLSSGLSDS